MEETKTKKIVRVRQLRLPPDVDDRLISLADKKHWSVNYYIVRLIQEHIKPR